MRRMASSLSGLARSGGSNSSSTVQRVYRLVDRQGNPHPVLDDLYDTCEAAWNEAHRVDPQYVGNHSQKPFIL